MRTWTCKDGTVRYKLADCKICGKKSNTTDKETAQIAFRYGRICRACIAKDKYNKTRPPMHGGKKF